MLSLLDKYILRLFITYFFSGFFTFITLFLVLDFTSKFSRYEASIGTLAKYYAYFLPEIASQMLPVAALLGTILTLTYLSRNNELVAMFSSGTSLSRIVLPIFIFVGGFCFLSFYISDRVVPLIVEKKNEIKNIEIKKYYDRKVTGIKNKMWFRNGNKLVYSQSIDLTNRVALGVSVFTLTDDWQLVSMARTKKATFDDVYWYFEKGKESLFNKGSSFPEYTDFKSKKVKIDKKVEDLNTFVKTPEAMSNKDLRSFIARNKASGLNVANYEIDYYSKYSFSIAALLLVLLSIPFSISRRRSGGGLIGVSICIGLVAAYWLFYGFSLNLGRVGTLKPIVAAWLPNAIVFLMSLYFLRRADV